MRKRYRLPVLLLSLLIPGWGSPVAAKEPEFIRVQHILISFKDKVPNKPPLERTKKGADALAPLSDILARFFAAHRKAYGYAAQAEPVEAINLRLTARGRAETGREAPPSGATTSPTPKDHRPVWFTADGPVDTPVYQRRDLAPATRIIGPAIVEQLDATTPIHPSDIATVDAAGNLLIEVRP